MIDAVKCLEYSVLLAETVAQLDFIRVLHKSRNRDLANIEKWTAENLEKSTLIPNDDNQAIIGRLKKVYPEVEHRVNKSMSVAATCFSKKNNASSADGDDTLVLSRASRLIIEEDSLFTSDLSAISQQECFCFHLIYLLELFNDLKAEITMNGSCKVFANNLFLLKLKSNLLNDTTANLQSQLETMSKIEKDFDRVVQLQSWQTRQLDEEVKKKRNSYTTMYMANLRLMRYFDRSAQSHQVETKKCLDSLIKNLINEKDSYKQMYTVEMDVFPVLLEQRRRGVIDLKNFETKWRKKYDEMTEKMAEQLNKVTSKLKRVRAKHADLVRKYSEYKTMLSQKLEHHV
jgi:hypothetical protein